ncbi:hypothetical protein M2277_000416 [Paenibacillus sp. LBL]|nr:hypothetical protein [Paenibacillus sp. LBL]MDH6669772.1 hypothetical protein [Paenibacillus sp. LBL]
MGIDWYDMIARRNGGYQGRAKYTVVGRSAEDMVNSRSRCPDMQSKS